jgi:LAGLIDADG DNA endonuclease family
MIDLPQFQFSTLIGLYLSEGSSVLTYVRNLNPKISQRNASFTIKQSLDKFNYFMMVFAIFSHYCTKLPTCIVGYRNKIITYSLSFYTRALPCFTELHKLFYDNSSSVLYGRIGKKIILKNIYH